MQAQGWAFRDGGVLVVFVAQRMWGAPLFAPTPPSQGAMSAPTCEQKVFTPSQVAGAGCGGVGQHGGTVLLAHAAGHGVSIPAPVKQQQVDFLACAWVAGGWEGESAGWRCSWRLLQGMVQLLPGLEVFG